MYNLDYHQEKRKKKKVTRKRKKGQIQSQKVHACSHKKQNKKFGLKAKLYHKQCRAEKMQMQITNKMHEKRNTKEAMKRFHME